MKYQLIEAIKRALAKLKDWDGELFDCHLDQEDTCDARKLHEVCINHKLANYLEAEILPLLRSSNCKYFVDIEFNREGSNEKSVSINNIEKRVRPDIIIHNRKSGEQKDNLLIVECKKKGAPNPEIIADNNKIQGLMTDSRYLYKFGLQVIYAGTGIEATFFHMGPEGQVFAVTL
jgi:hypothetical protein